MKVYTLVRVDVENPQCTYVILNSFKTLKKALNYAKKNFDLEQERIDESGDDWTEGHPLSWWIMADGHQMNLHLIETELL